MINAGTERAKRDRASRWRGINKRHLSPAQRAMRFSDLYSVGPVRVADHHPNMQTIKKERPMKASEYKYAIFSIHSTGPHTINILHNLLSMAGHKFTPCMGKWQGTVETSWLVEREALDYLLSTPLGKWLLRSEEAFLLVSECNKQYAALWYTKDNRIEPVGNMHNVGKNKPSGDYTYRCDTGNYHVVRKGNPDRTPPPAGHQPKEVKGVWKQRYNSLERVQETGKVSPADAIRIRATMLYIKRQFGM